MIAVLNKLHIRTYQILFYVFNGSKIFPKQLLKKVTRFVNTVTRFVNIDTKVTRFVNIGPPAIFLEKDY